MNFEQTPEFKKELKRLTKKWHSLPSDIKDAELQVASLYDNESDEKSLREYRAAFFNGKRATVLSTSQTREVIKMRLDVASMGTSSKVRVVFVMIRADNTVTFVEIFSKSDKPREDVRRIRKYI